MLERNSTAVLWMSGFYKTASNLTIIIVGIFLRGSILVDRQFSPIRGLYFHRYNTIMPIIHCIGMLVSRVKFSFFVS